MALKLLLFLFMSLAVTSKGRRSRNTTQTLSREALKLRSVANSKAESMAGVTIAAGTTLRSRYVLDSRLYRRDLGAKRRERRPSRNSPKVGSDFPDSEHFPKIPSSAKVNDYAQGADGPKHLGKGSFGDVWKAYDLHRQEHVAIKFFFDEEAGADNYLTPSLAEKTRDGFSVYMEESLYECQEAMEIMEEESIDPEGAQHICQCFDEHVTSAEENDPFFLVFELCGTALDEVYDKRSRKRDAPENSPAWVRTVIKQVLHGIKFLSSVHPPRVHHDLKLENIAITSDGRVKLLDFGAVQPFIANQEGGVCSPQYTPPEVICASGPSFRFPGRPFEFDVYSAGLMYWELICEDSDRPGWEEDSQNEAGYQITSWIPEDRSCQRNKKGIGNSEDIEIIKSMMDKNPDQRASPDQLIKALSAFTEDASGVTLQSEEEDTSIEIDIDEGEPDDNASGVTLQSDEEDTSIEIDIDEGEPDDNASGVTLQSDEEDISAEIDFDKDEFMALKRSERWAKVEKIESDLVDPLLAWIKAEWKAIRKENKTLNQESRRIKALKKDHYIKRRAYHRRISEAKKENKKLNDMRGKVRGLKKLAKERGARRPANKRGRTTRTQS